MDTATRTAIASTVSGLSDNQLLEQTGKLARLDHQIQVFVIDHLLEIETRRVYLSRGFSGLFDYVARGLGYSDAAAWRRINAMKLCAQVEEAHERLRDGSLTLDAAAQLQPPSSGVIGSERARRAAAGPEWAWPRSRAARRHRRRPVCRSGSPRRSWTHRHFGAEAVRSGRPGNPDSRPPTGVTARSRLLQLRGSGERAPLRIRLQVDHVFPYALGGSAEAGNPRPLQ